MDTKNKKFIILSILTIFIGLVLCFYYLISADFNEITNSSASATKDKADSFSKKTPNDKEKDKSEDDIIFRRYLN